MLYEVDMKMDDHISVLELLVDKIPDEIDWAVTGSTAFAIQNIPVEPKDIDIQSSKDGVFTIEEHLSSYSKQPVRFSHTETIASYFGSLRIDGIEVELMGDIQHRVDGKWTTPVEIAPLVQMISVNGFDVPVLDLRHEYQAYKMMGRDDRAELLRKYF